jgi:hypothetical protein
VEFKICVLSVAARLVGKVNDLAGAAGNHEQTRPSESAKPVIPGVTPAVANPPPTTIRLRTRSSQSFRRGWAAGALDHEQLTDWSDGGCAPWRQLEAAWRGDVSMLGLSDSPSKVSRHGSKCP